MKKLIVDIKSHVKGKKLIYVNDKCISCKINLLSKKSRIL